MPLIFMACAVLLAASIGVAGESKPKYVPKDSPRATPLSRSWEHFLSRRGAGPDFWALILHYVGQHDGRSCSVASVAMVVNVARAGTPLTSDDKLVSQADLLQKVTTEDWKAKVGPGGKGVKLDQLGAVLGFSLKAQGLKVAAFEVVHAEAGSAPSRERFHRALVENEQSSRDFIVANFLQSDLTDDATVGHIAPVGAYDGKRRWGSSLILTAKGTSPIGYPRRRC